MQSRRNILIVALFVIIGLMFVAAGALVYRGFADFYRVETELQARKGELERFYERNPFPSEANLAMERTNLTVIAGELADLLAVMGQGQIESVNQSPPKFMAQFWDARRELKAKAKEMGVNLANGDDFDFGFGRHLQGNLPAPQDVPRLTQQLKITEALCGVLYAARISELQGIGREEFEVDAVGGSAGAKPATTGGARRRAEAAAVSLNTIAAAAGLIPDGKLYGNWHFVLVFTAKESALMSVLNGLARHPAFAVVTRLDIDSKGSLFERSGEAARLSRKSGADSAVKSAETVKEGPVIVPRDQRIVCGHESPLMVRLELDVFQFVKMQAGKPDQKAKGAK
jgi:hypothetical protein